MPTSLTTPLSISLGTMTVESLQIDLKRNSNGTVDMANSIYTVDLAFRDSTGTIMRNQNISMAAQDLPAGVKTALRGLTNTTLTALRSAGLVPAGADTNDL